HRRHQAADRPAGRVVPRPGERGRAHEGGRRPAALPGAQSLPDGHPGRLGRRRGRPRRPGTGPAAVGGWSRGREDVAVETWRRILREGLLRSRTEDELQALRRGLASDDPALLQGMMTLPPPLECLHDWQVEGADLTAYPGWRGRGLTTVREVEETAWALCSA